MTSRVTESDSLGVAGSVEGSKFVMTEVFIDTEYSWNNCLLSARFNWIPWI